MMILLVVVFLSARLSIGLKVTAYGFEYFISDPPKQLAHIFV